MGALCSAVHAVVYELSFLGVYVSESSILFAPYMVVRINELHDKYTCRCRRGYIYGLRAYDYCSILACNRICQIKNSK